MSETRRSALSKLLQALVAAPLALLPFGKRSARASDDVAPRRRALIPDKRVSEEEYWRLAYDVAPPPERYPVRMLVGGNRGGTTYRPVAEAAMQVAGGGAKPLTRVVDQFVRNGVRYDVFEAEDGHRYEISEAIESKPLTVSWIVPPKAEWQRAIDEKIIEMCKDRRDSELRFWQLAKEGLGKKNT